MTTIGYATLPVIPSFDGLQKAINRELQGLGILGRRAGSDIGDGVKSGIKSADLDSALSQSLGGAEAAGKRAGGDVGGGVGSGIEGKSAQISTVITGVVASAGVAAGVLAGVAVVDGITDAIERGVAGDKLAAQLGLTPTESATVGRVSGQLYVDAFGESIPAINASLRSIFENGLLPRNAGEADVEALGQKLINFTSTFDQEAGDVSRAVGQLINTGLAVNTEHALDVLTTGFQRGANRAGDLLDTVTEYSTEFRQFGIDAEHATGLLLQGLQAGARDGDIVADAIKEIVVRAQSGDSAGALATIGIDLNTLRKNLAKGGPEALSSLDEVFDKMREYEARTGDFSNAIGIGGTQAEDLQQAFLALDPSTAVTDLGIFAGAADNAGNVLNDNLGTKIESIKRKLEPGSLFAAFDEGGFEGVKTQLSEAFGEIGAIWDQYGPDIRETLSNGWAEVQVWWETTAKPWVDSVLIPELQKKGEEIGNALVEKLPGALSNAVTALGQNAPKLMLLGHVLTASFLLGLGKGLVDSVPPSARSGLKLIPGFGPWIGALEDLGEIKVPEFAGGGIVPGRVGEPRVIIAHGGERVLSNAELAAGVGTSSSGFEVGGITIVGARSPEQTAQRTVLKMRELAFHLGAA